MNVLPVLCLFWCAPVSTNGTIPLHYLASGHKSKAKGAHYRGWYIVLVIAGMIISVLKLLQFCFSLIFFPFYIILLHLVALNLMNYICTGCYVNKAELHIHNLFCCSWPGCYCSAVCSINYY